MTIDQLKQRHAALTKKIEQLGQLTDSHLDGVRQHFHLGTVGSAGPNNAKLNARRARSMDMSIDRAKKQIELMRELQVLEGQIKDIESGALERARTVREEIERRLRSSKPGDKVLDSAYGVVAVVRANQKSLTIMCDSGYKEARPYSLIVGPCA
ncbi:hypothetical protein HGI30_15330 [Paenibacillus albicereus]|uniref:Uncharacterized protein n=1 Tax=Paenibacillus albicereus TaxID=2726185 RepID=A0A6H2GZE0_9BACL|nr:hypothetical protein [Paenibacillus albicereus]QJC52804.1 hypothetical protein HGI30_15330 [Paenibacillus albicereus]